MDAAQDAARAASLKRLAETRGLPYLEISSVTGRGLDALKHAIGEHVLAGQPASSLAE